MSKLLGNRAEALNKIKARRASEKTSSQEIKRPIISGRAAVTLVAYLRSLDDFKARSLAKSGRKVIR